MPLLNLPALGSLATRLAPALLAALLVSTVCTQQVEAQSDPSATGASLNQILADVNRLLDTVTLDATRLTPAATANVLRDASTNGAFRFIQQEVAFDAYNGSMRGARGTLFSLGGNALDRSLLLGEMLSTYGVTWRLATAELDDTRSVELLHAATRRGSWSGSAIPATARVFDVGTDMRHRNAIQNHWWVQAEVRGNWIDLDPAFPSFNPGDSVGPPSATYPAGALPAEFEQTVQITLHYATSGTDGGRVLSYTGTLADVSYRNLTLSFANEGSRMVPSLAVSGETVRGQPVLTGGLERVWVEMFFRLRGVEERVERDLFVADSVLDAFRVDDQVHAIVLLPGFVGPDYFRAVVFSQFSSIGERIERMRGLAALPSTDGNVPAAVRAELNDLLALSAGLSSLAFAHVSDGIALRLANAIGVRPFYERPRVLISSAYRDGDQIFHRLDLRNNSIDGMAWDGVPVPAQFAFQAMRGRVDSSLEGRVLEAMTGRDVLTIGELFRLARESGSALRTIHSGNVARLDAAGYSAEATRRLQSEVTGSGWVALAPSAAVPTGGAATIGWWRLEPASGSVLGVAEFGMNPAWSVLTGNAETVSSTGNVSERLFAQMVALLGNVGRNSVAIAMEQRTFDEVVCEARCDLQLLRQGICSDRPGRVLESCLTGGNVRGGDILQVSRTCGAQVQPFSCGVEAFEGALDGSIVVTNDAGIFSGPWPSVRPLSSAGCSCR